MFPVGLGHSPTVLGIPLQSLQPFALLLFRQVEPELEQEHAFVGEHALEPDDLLRRLVKVGVRGFTVDVLQKGLGVPSSEEDASLALGGQRLPETPQRRAILLILGGRVHDIGLHVTRVHPEVEQVKGLPLAGTVHAGDQDDYREASLVQ